MDQAQGQAKMLGGCDGDGRGEGKLANPVRSKNWSSHHGSVVNPTKNHEVVGSIPDLAQRVKDPVLP